MSKSLLSGAQDGLTKQSSILPSINLPFKMLPPKSLKRHPRADFLGINKKLVQVISADMGSNGFELSRPIVAWENEGNLYIADGRTRTQAAMEAGIKEVPVFFAKFSSEDSFVEASIKAQTRRRNTKIGDGLKIIETLWPIKAAEAKRRQEHRGELILPGGGAPQEDSQDEHGRVCDIIGKELGMSGETARRLKKIIDFSKKFGTSHRDEMVLGERTNIHETYNEIMAMEKETLKGISRPSDQTRGGNLESSPGKAGSPPSLSAEEELEGDSDEESEKMEAEKSLASRSAPAKASKAHPTAKDSPSIVEIDPDVFNAILGLIPTERFEELSDIMEMVDGEAREMIEDRISEHAAPWNTKTASTFRGSK